MKLISLPVLEAKTAGCKASIYRWIKERDFPKPIKIGRKSVWDEADVDAWLTARKAESSGEATPTNEEAGQGGAE